MHGCRAPVEPRHHPESVKTSATPLGEKGNKHGYWPQRHHRGTPAPPYAKRKNRWGEKCGDTKHTGPCGSKLARPHRYLLGPKPIVRAR